MSGDVETISQKTEAVMPAPAEAMASLADLAAKNGGEYKEPPECEGSFGRTLFDTPSSDDASLTVVLPAEAIDAVPSQSLLRILSLPDKREFTGIVSAGPFAEPNGLNPQSAGLVISAVNKAVMMPSYHGRLNVTLLSEELNGWQAAPRHRPKPNSPVWTIPDDQMAEILNIKGDVHLGVVDGHESIEVLAPSDDKSVFPRHTGILGTTGGGKSTTVARLIAELQAANNAVVIFDTEGEYTTIHKPTTNQGLLRALEARQRQPAGLKRTHVYHVVNRECSNPSHPNITAFSLRLSNISLWALKEILELTDPQEERLFVAYELAKKALAASKVFPATTADDLKISDFDEFSEGWPHLTLQHLLYAACICHNWANKTLDEPPFVALPNRWNFDEIKRMVNTMEPPKMVPSWRALIGRLGRLNRMKMFDQPCPELDYAKMLQPGSVAVIDLSDLDNYNLKNLAIAELLRGIQNYQEGAYKSAAAEGKTPAPINIMIEEAHEFLSAHRIGKMPIIREQIERIARRGRKRYLGLTFITQMPQHLPDELLALINNWMIHKVADESVIRRLQKVVQNVDAGIWGRVGSLAPGQALVSLTHMRKALLTLVHPSPCELRMTD